MQFYEKKLYFQRLEESNYGKQPIYYIAFVYVYWAARGLYDSQASNRSSLEGRDFSHRVLPVFYWSPGSRIWLLITRLCLFI
jgi:hypothetical protein